ncbi:pro-sigmaK processing inhibitor BofA family protein [Sporolactobacillus vineae]|uniref:pro-sigmaK processing inhibitor BofA family protein n=1 Tax=Sporolactobacillus vineae TaxID=444463 RepID=UPI000287BC53|nr:pro-sigmaK processing inhibitor BofA family protein [Sporolactobacillus vineae]
MTGYLWIAAVLIGVFFLMILCFSFHPLKWAGRVIVRTLVGVFFLFLLNTAGASFSFHIPINLITAAVSGLLGVPGIAALILIKYTMGV